MTQIELMQVALDLSKDFKFTAKPNPVVGALVVRNGEIVAQGAHESWGKNHAEINCLNNLDKSLPKDELTLYVTLEPCNHFGKTPPCTDAIIQSGIKKVVIGALDPNPKVAGQGIQKLIDANIDVVHGVLASEVADANKFFFFRHIHKRPFITIKIASSSDGMSHAEDGSIKWITSPAAREDVQHLRAEYDAIITGGNTVRNDNPQMNARVDYPINQPKKILLSSESNWDKDLKFFDAPVSIIDSRNLQDVLHSLIDEDICSALVEAGPSLVNAFLEDGLCEELVVYQSPNPIGAKGISWFDDGNTIEKFGFKHTSSYTIDRDKKTTFVRC